LNFAATEDLQKSYFRFR